MKYYLIDDDELVRLTWEMRAKRVGISLITFDSHLSFLENIEIIPKDSNIYIDSELGSFKGETLALQLFNEGFQNISITSGHQADKFSKYAFLKSVISKAAPF